MRRVLSLSLTPLSVLLGLIGHTLATSPTFPNGTERDDNGTDVDADASKSNSASLEKFCSAQLNSFVATYQSTEIATSRWTWYEGFGPTDSLGDLTGSVTSQTYWTSTFLCKFHTDRIHEFYFLPACFVSVPRIAAYFVLIFLSCSLCSCFHPRFAVKVCYQTPLRFLDRTFP